MALLATRRQRHFRLPDAALLDAVQYPEALGARDDLEPLGDNPTVRYEVPSSGPVVLTSIGIPLDEVEDLLPESDRIPSGRVWKNFMANPEITLMLQGSTRSPENSGRNAGALRA